ncbi:hypothetical protein [uncultured Algimonas sp.]|uniref:hypothetical protein n=1 Tax=uncultured Algimonas sp. TaxID=1547920 RepID=UPI00261AA369|nr:hypothetical protein [uncultured Algimonas sp.]
MNDPQRKPPATPQSKPRRRASRYQRAQERRQAQRRADQRFYNLIFGVVGACVLVVLGLAMIASSGQSPTVSAGTQMMAEDIVFGLSGIEIAGLAVVTVIAVFLWRRISKR